MGGGVRKFKKGLGVAVGKVEVTAVEVLDKGEELWADLVVVFGTVGKGIRVGGVFRQLGCR